MRALLFPVLLAAAAGCTSSKPAVAPDAVDHLPFIEDDYGKAVTVAKEKSLPIFVDVWAPW